MREHFHKFTALWSHWGQYGPEDQHFHSCFKETCGTLLVGSGRDCDGRSDTHDLNYPKDRVRSADKDA